jgi:hypothetical protein
VASAYSDTDGATAAFSRQASGAIASEINCVGVTSATGCETLTPGLAHAVSIAGSPDASTQDVYVGSQFAPLGTDGAIAELTRELAPACTDQAASTEIGRPVTVAIGCSDANLDPMTLSVAVAPTHGTLAPIDQAGGTVVYTPAAGYRGSDSFRVQASDGTLSSGIGTVTITVSPGRTPVLSGLALRPASFRAAPSGASIATAKRQTGTTVSYRDSLGSRTTFTITATHPGVRFGKRCAHKKHHRPHGKKPCIRRVKLGSFGRSDKAGANTFHFTGRVKGRALKPGAYELTAQPQAGGSTGRPVTVRFQVVR